MEESQHNIILVKVWWLREPYMYSMGFCLINLQHNQDIHGF